MHAVTITQITYPELEGLIEKSIRKILSGKTVEKPVHNTGHRKVLNVDQVCKITNLSKSRLYALAAEGAILNFKKGNRLIFYEDDVLRWIESGRRYSQQEIDAAADEALLNKHTA